MANDLCHAKKKTSQKTSLKLMVKLSKELQATKLGITNLTRINYTKKNVIQLN